MGSSCPVGEKILGIGSTACWLVFEGEPKGSSVVEVVSRDAKWKPILEASRRASACSHDLNWVHEKRETANADIGGKHIHIPEKQMQMIKGHPFEREEQSLFINSTCPSYKALEESAKSRPFMAPSLGRADCTSTPREPLRVWSSWLLQAHDHGSYQGRHGRSDAEARKA